MKKLSYKHFLVIITSLIIFGAGFTSGMVKGRDAFAQSVQDVDMTEFWRVWDVVQNKYVPTHDGESLQII
jgi:hypothetical protein